MIRGVLMAAVLLAGASAAAGGEPGWLGASAPAKDAVPAVENRPAASRQGGDTLLDAVPLPWIPFEVSGTTSGFNDDYDEVCPYFGSVSPDVVYSLDPDESQMVAIDLGGSSYDTKVYVYDGAGSLVACNDDFYADFTSRIEWLVLEPAAGPYHVVIDGYGGDYGDYLLRVEPFVPCEIEVSGLATQEGEPPLVEDYVDVYNGGCNSPEQGSPMQTIPWGQPWATWFQGRSGYYLLDGSPQRDTDWFRVFGHSYDNPLHVTVEAEEPSYLMYLSPNDCSQVTVSEYVESDDCERATIEFWADSGQEYWFWVGPQSFSSPDGSYPHEYDYSLWVGGPVPPADIDLGDYSYSCDRIEDAFYHCYFSLNSLSDWIDFAGGCGQQHTLAGDGVLEIYLAAGDEFWMDFNFHYNADERTWGPYYLALVTDCRMTPGSCVDWEVADPYQHSTAFEAAQTGWHYVVFDAEDGDRDLGGYFLLNRTDVAEPPLAPAFDTCEGASAIEPGPIDVDADLSAARNSFDPGPEGCVDATELVHTGRDGVFRVDFVAFQTLDAVMTGEGDWEEALYLVRDCEAPVGTCVTAGVAEEEGVRLTYTATEAETLWLVCDSWGIGPRAFSLEGNLDVATAAPVAGAPGPRLSCAPNPFNPATRLVYDVPASGTPTRLDVFDGRGRRVRTLVDEPARAGKHEVSWDGRDDAGRAVASGSYIVRLAVDDATATRKVLLFK